MRKVTQKKYTSWIVVIALAGLIKIISLNPNWVEDYYTYDIYPNIGRSLRYVLGWLPISVGDLLYSFVIVFLIYKFVLFIKKSDLKANRRKQLRELAKKTLFVGLWVYVLFYGLWGLNYSRVGIAGQLQLEKKEYTIQDLDTLVGLLSTKLNEQASLITPEVRDSFRKKKSLFANAFLLYKIASKKYSFLEYKNFSVKPSLFSYLGNYMGFQGYYNPFTGEAQVNTTIPQSLEPLVAAHEIAHQLGYAKESEANFVAFLACRLHPSVDFTYSAYFDMYNYAIHKLALMDSSKADYYQKNMHPQVKKDITEYKAFYQKYRNPIEPYIDKIYSTFLKANNQPKGRGSYNEVTIWLIAYYKKYGLAAI